MKIAHLTSVHPRYDARIYLKQCRSLAQAGLLGVTLYSLLMALYWRLGDLIAREHGNALPISILVIPVVMMLTTPNFFTVTLSHGGALSLLVLLVLTEKKENYGVVHRTCSKC